MSVLRPFLRSVQILIDNRFTAKRNLVQCGTTGILRYEISKWNFKPIHLSDGQVLDGNSTVISLHLDSSAVARAYSGTSEVRGILKLFAGFKESLLWIAEKLERDPSLAEVSAICAATHLSRELARFGFEVLKLPAIPWVFIGTYMRYLEWLYSERPKEHPIFGRSLIPSLNVMSRVEFLRRFSKGNPLKTSGVVSRENS